MLDPILSLAFSLHSNKGAYALLLGSGVSRAAGVPTGWEVVQSLVRKIAAASGEEAQVEPDPIAWYRTRYGEEPNYTGLLDSLAKTQAERAGLLRGYFEPTEEERERKQKQPTAAHRAIATLVASGHVRIIVTTNFDRLLEQALDDVGVVPIVVASPDQAEGALPLVHPRCFVLKIHGDYLDTRIKNTAEELEAYDPRINRLLDQVFDDFGLVIAGWSGDWDPALRGAIERCKTRRFMTYWSTRSPLNGVASALAMQRRAQEIVVRDADTFFVDLREKLEALERLDQPHPMSAQIAVERLKRYLTEERTIDLHDLVMGEVERLYGRLGPDRFPLQGDVNLPTKERFLERIRQYEALTHTLVSLFANGVYWGGSRHAALWTKALERIWNSHGDAAGYIVWSNLRRYPALLIQYASGVAGVAASDYVAIQRLLTGPQLHGERDRATPGASLCCLDVIEDRTVQSWLMDRRYTPVSDHLVKVLRPHFSSLVPDEARYTEAFGRWEYLYALHRAHTDNWIPLGQFAWRESGREESIIGPVTEEAGRLGTDWPPLKAGMFGGTVDGFQEAGRRVIARVRQAGWH